MASMIGIKRTEYKELKENSHRYHRMMSKLGITGIVETHFEDACKEIGRLQGFEQGVEAAIEFLKT